MARNSKKWKRLYDMRSGIERMNGRIDRDYKFEKHTIRGLEKMEMFLTVTFIVNLTLAKSTTPLQATGLLTLTAVAKCEPARTWLVASRESKIEAGIKEGLARLYA